VRRSEIHVLVFFFIAAILILASAACIDTENCARKSDCSNGLICVANACVTPPASGEGGVSVTSGDDAGTTASSDPDGG